LRGGLYAAVSARHGILSRCAVTPPAREGRPAPPAGSPSRLKSAVVERVLQKSLIPPTLVIDEHLEVVYLAGDTSRLLDFAEGTPSAGVLDLLRRDLRAHAHAALAAALRDRHQVVTDVVAPGHDGAAREVRLTVRPLPPLGVTGPLFALSLQE